MLDDGHRRARIVMQLQEFGPRVVADGIHHPLAFRYEAHVEIGDEQTFAFAHRRNDVTTLRRNDRRAIAAA